MSNVHADKLVHRLSATTLKAVWRQWATLGVTLSGDGRVSQAAIDPDALLLITSVFLEQEPRLRDVIASWLTTRSTTLGVQRVRNLVGRFPPAVAAQLPALAALAFDRGKDHRWKALMTRGTAPSFGDRGKSLVVPLPYRPAAGILLQLRAGMGVGVKADTLGYLLCATRGSSGWATVASIARMLAYTPGAVRRAADEMVDGHFLVAPGSMDPNAPGSRMYRAETGGWAAVLDLVSGIPTWTPWDQHFAFTAKLMAWQVETAERTVTDYAFAVALRQLLIEHPRAIAKDDPTPGSMPSSTDELLPYFEERLSTWENWAGQFG